MLFQTGYNYQDTINKFADGTFDLGYIGPAPYVLANKGQSIPLRIIAGVENNHTPFFHSVIVTKNNSPISDLDDLKGKSIAFGSPKSTLSYYVPMQTLINREGH